MDKLHADWAKARKQAVGRGTFSRVALEGSHIHPGGAGGAGGVSTYPSAGRCGAGRLAAGPSTAGSCWAAERPPAAGDVSGEQWWGQRVWQPCWRCCDQPLWGGWLLGLLLLLELLQLRCSWAAQLPRAPCMETSVQCKHAAETPISNHSAGKYPQLLKGFNMIPY